MKISQRSNFGKKYSPIEDYFEYLEDLDVRILMATRHRAAKNPVKYPKGLGYKDDPKKNNESTWSL